ncbi:MAG: hypothetical protein HYY08_04765 [Firmicutes bacterium]|nr:hypothetical protein [Bacillota bacterium]
MSIPANCRTTAMGIMPHTDIDRALNLARSLDIPFWPQLPNVSFFEDMYAQASEHFPGIRIDAVEQKVLFDTSRFAEELMSYAAICDQDETSSLTEKYSVVYRRFLAQDLRRHAAVRGQMIGPVSFGFRAVDETLRPVIYDDEVRTLMFDFVQKKVNLQYRELAARNSNAFVWLDEPGLGWVFSAMSGYTDVAAKIDYGSFLEGIEGPKALHLCANINLPYLLGLDLDLLSFDAYQIGSMPLEYVRAIGEFLKRGGILSWGIVPTDSENIAEESAEKLAVRLRQTWEKISVNCAIEPERVAAQALIAPARCCLKNAGKVGSADDVKGPGAGGARVSSDEERIVETAFAVCGQLSTILQQIYGLAADS